MHPTNLGTYMLMSLPDSGKDKLICVKIQMFGHKSSLIQKEIKEDEI
jgi:hypothetical protein